MSDPHSSGSLPHRPRKMLTVSAREQQALRHAELETEQADLAAKLIAAEARQARLRGDLSNDEMHLLSYLVRSVPMAVRVTSAAEITDEEANDPLSWSGEVSVGECVGELLPIANGNAVGSGGGLPLCRSHLGELADRVSAALGSLEDRGFLKLEIDPDHESETFGFTVTEVGRDYLHARGRLAENHLAVAVSADGDDLGADLNAFLDSVDVLSYWSRLPDVILFHEAAIGDELVGPHERRLLVRIWAAQEWVAQRPGASIEWSSLIDRSEAISTRATANLIRVGFVVMPESIDRQRDGTYDARLMPAAEWAGVYTEQAHKRARRIGHKHRRIVRMAQLTPPSDPCPCESGARAEDCCQVHSRSRQKMLLTARDRTFFTRFSESITERVKPLPQRNDPCLCWSGKKFKQCCGKTGVTRLVDWWAASWTGGTS